MLGPWCRCVHRDALPRQHAVEFGYFARPLAGSMEGLGRQAVNDLSKALLRPRGGIMLKAALICSTIVVLFDALASLVSKYTGASYGWFSFGSAAMYLIMGYVLTNRVRLNLKAAIITLLCAASTEATLGWLVSWLIGPGKLAASGGGTAVSVMGLVFGAVFAVGFGTLFGWLGSLVGRAMLKKVGSSP